MPQTIGMMHILPLLPSFRAHYPRIKPEWHFETRQVDLIAEGYDVAIGGGLRTVGWDYCACTRTGAVSLRSRRPPI